MRQAGRYLPEYRALRERHEFKNLVRAPELAAEATLQPIARFGFDAAIVFSDILVVPEAMGQPYRFKEQGGIQMEFKLADQASIDALDVEGIAQRMDYLAQTIRIVRGELGKSRALIGFCGAPWTLACYMVEGGTPGDFRAIKSLALTQPALFDVLMEKLARATRQALHMQIAAGADAVQIFDSWAGACPGCLYEHWSLRWIRETLRDWPPGIPVILFARGFGGCAVDLLVPDVRVIGVDAAWDLRSLKTRLPENIALQGNLDPMVLTLTPAIAGEETLRVLRCAEGRKGYIFNLGHGITPDARIESVEAMADAVVNAPCGK
jgi:uroporphyrinogen decarboxylase